MTTPTVMELATIAAQLARRGVSATQLATEAHDLWDACREELDTVRLHPADIQFNQMQVPTPKRYPVSFKEFLRLLVGGRSVAKREDVYQDYEQDRFYSQHGRKPTPAELTGLMKSVKRKYSQTEYGVLARYFMCWLTQRQKEGASKAACHRWSQARRKKANIGRLEKNALDIELPE